MVREIYVFGLIKFLLAYRTIFIMFNQFSIRNIMLDRVLSVILTENLKKSNIQKLEEVEAKNKTANVLTHRVAFIWKQKQI